MPAAEPPKPYESVAKWLEDIDTKRKIKVDEAMKPVETDDAVSSSKKQAAGGNIAAYVSLKNNRAAILKMENQQSVGVLRAMEAQLTAAGRLVLGTKWNEKACGVGMLDSKCGEAAA